MCVHAVASSQRCPAALRVKAMHCLQLLHTASIPADYASHDEENHEQMKPRLSDAEFAHICQPVMQVKLTAKVSPGGFTMVVVVKETQTPVAGGTTADHALRHEAAKDHADQDDKVLLCLG